MNTYNLVPIDTYLFHYIKTWYHIIYPCHTTSLSNKIIIVFIHILHTIVILFNVIGAFLPPRYLIYYILFTLCILSVWYICVEHCPLLLITYPIDQKYYDFLPMTNKFRFTIIFILLIWSIIGYTIPNLSLFRIFKKMFDFISNKYDTS